MRLRDDKIHIVNIFSVDRPFERVLGGAAMSERFKYLHHQADGITLDHIQHLHDVEESIIPISKDVTSAQSMADKIAENINHDTHAERLRVAKILGTSTINDPVSPMCALFIWNIMHNKFKIMQQFN